MSVSYSCVLLDSESKEKVAKRFPHLSITHAHHMTITLGPLQHPKQKHDLHLDWKIGETVYIYAIAVRSNLDRSVVCLRVLTDGRRTRTTFPHVTLHVGEGRKPKESNQLTIERRLSQPIVLKGVVTEIPNKKSSK